MSGYFGSLKGIISLPFRNIAFKEKPQAISLQFIRSNGWVLLIQTGFIDQNLDGSGDDHLHLFGRKIGRL